MCSKGLSNHVYVCPSVCLSVDKNIENTNTQLKCVVIRSEKGTITTFELFLEGHGADSAIYDLKSCSCKSSHFLFIIIARLPRPSSIRIYGTKHAAY